MAKQSINTLRQFFRTALKPTETQFWDMLDSFFHKDEKIPISAIDKLQEEFDRNAGRDGITPHIGEDGYWYIGTETTGVKADAESIEIGDQVLLFENNLI